jgi:hypothetical protein
MNERIKQLAEQATSYNNSDGWLFDKEKFAQLIVRECARVYWRIDDGEIHGEYVNALKKHFGVEE